MALENAYVPF